VDQGGGCRIKQCAANPKSPTAKEVTQAALEGDPEAKALVSQLVEYLGLGLSNLINIFNPDIVVLGGGVALGMGDLLLKPVTDYIRTHTFALHSTALPVVLSPLAGHAGLLGCIFAILEEA
jgi:glucokinase